MALISSKRIIVDLIDPYLTKLNNTKIFYLDTFSIFQKKTHLLNKVQEKMMIIFSKEKEFLKCWKQYVPYSLYTYLKLRRKSEFKQIRD